MSDFYDDEDDASTRQQKAHIGQIMRYLWRHWSSQPLKFAAVVILMMASTACELLLPALSGQIVEALTAGPEAADRAFELFWLFAAIAAGMFVLRNILVRVWNLFAAR
ncbi:MAG: hypothetical protein ACK5ZD_06270, partial [Hyphomonadaceae bacterium]